MFKILSTYICETSGG